MATIKNSQIKSKNHMYNSKQNVIKLLPIVFLVQLFALGANAQQPPLPVEFFLGHRAINYQHLINKNLFHDRFNFFNVTSFEAEHDRNENNHFVVSSLFSYNLGKGFSIGVGGEIQRPGTFAIVGAQYAFASKCILLVFFPSVNITGPTAYAHFTLFEYRPNFTDKFNGFFRAQLLATTDFSIYNRGYQQLRAGLQLKNIQFGFAANFDQFDNSRITTDNYGLFVRALIF